MNKSLVAVAAMLLLAGCTQAVRTRGNPALLAAQTAREHALAGVDHWVLQGRLGVSDGHDGGSGSLRWSQDGDRYEFVLRGPAISGANFRLSGDARGAMLEGVKGGPLRGPDAEALMRKALGWEVPLRDLRAWVLGLRADSGPAELSFGDPGSAASGLPSLLLQDGWSVDYRAWDTTHQPPLPSKVYASRPPYKVRLSIDSFVLGRDAAPATDGSRP